MQGMEGSGPGAGTDGHTWEDEGEFDPQAAGSPRTGRDRPSSDRGQHIDDFEKFYAGTRLEDAEVLLASEQGQEVDGRVDLAVTRLTGSDEQAFAPQLDVPAAYQREAVEAIETDAAWAERPIWPEPQRDASVLMGGSDDREAPEVAAEDSSPTRTQVTTTLERWLDNLRAGRAR